MNKSNNNGNVSSGISFTGALFIAFLVLKLTGVISWSWWWVTAPLWGTVLIVLALVFAIVAMDK